MSCNSVIARALSTVFLAGEFEANSLVERGSHLLGKRWRWLRPLAKRVVEAFRGRTKPRRITVAKFLLADSGFIRACNKHDLFLRDLLAARWTMSPVSVARSWIIPPITTPGELSDWLDLTVSELEWFADLRSLEYKRDLSKLSHYRYRTLTKRFGQIRLVEAPKPRLKQIQRRILEEILDRIPPHSSAHGFCAGRSIQTFAAPHANKTIVVKFDLQDFFPSISVAWVQALFRTIGYPEPVADLLGGLCTNSAPLEVWDRIAFTDEKLRNARWRYAGPHLPQGAPTSPALANLCAFRLDCRLSGLAESAGAIYTRYADDLAFSGDQAFARVAKRFQIHVGAIVMDEGFSVHHRKTRIMRQGVCQRLAGLVINNHLNVPREDFDRLKATLTNCIRLGPESQNRGGHQAFRSHLDGRVSFVEMINPTKGKRVRELFDRIEWKIG